MRVALWWKYVHHLPYIQLAHMDLEVDAHIATARLLSWQLEPLSIGRITIVFSELCGRGLSTRLLDLMD